MSLLEDRLIGIVEGRTAGLDEVAIAERVGVPVEMVRSYEEEAQRVIRAGRSEGSGLSEIAFGIVSKFYQGQEAAVTRREVGTTPVLGVGEDTPLSMLDLPQRIAERLEWHGIKTIGDVVGRTQEELLEVRFMGNKKLSYLVSALGARGYSLKPAVQKIDKRRVNSTTLVQQAIVDGASSRRVVAERTGLHYNTVSKVVNGEGIELEHGGRKYSDRQLVELAEKGMLLKESAEFLGMHSRQHIDQLFRRIVLVDGKPVCLRDIWREARRKSKLEEKEKLKPEKERKEAIGRIAMGVVDFAYDGSSWAEQRAFDYFNKTIQSPSRYSFDEMRRFYDTYRLAIVAGAEISLTELAKRSGLENPETKAMTARRFLKVLGLKNPSGQTKKQLPVWKKEALARIKEGETGISNTCIGKLMGMSDDHVKLYLRYSGQRVGIIRGGRGMLTYSNAPDVYEAFDEGHSIDEISELTGVSRKNIQHAILHERAIAGEISRTLQAIFPSRQSEQPYLSPEERRLVYSNEG